MARRFSRPRLHDDIQAEQRDVFSPDVTRLLFVAFGTAALVGLVSGTIWIVWNLLRTGLSH